MAQRNRQIPLNITPHAQTIQDPLGITRDHHGITQGTPQGPPIIQDPILLDIQTTPDQTVQDPFQSDQTRRDRMLQDQILHDQILQDLLAAPVDQIL